MTRGPTPRPSPEAGEGSGVMVPEVGARVSAAPASAAAPGARPGDSGPVPPVTVASDGRNFQ